MSKKSRQRNPSPPQKVTSPATTPVVSVTPDEKEGFDKKQQLIQEGETRKQELIAEGESEKSRIIEEAKKDASDEAARIKEGEIKKFKEEAIKSAEEERGRIISEANTVKSDAESLLKKANEKEKSLDEKSKSLEKQNEEHLKKFSKFQLEKDSYKNEILSEIQNEIEELNKKINILEEEKHQLELKNTQLERNISFSNADKEELESELSNYNELYGENSKLKTRISGLEWEYTTLNDIRQTLQGELNEKTNIILRFGDDPQKLLSENSALNEKIAGLEDRLAGSPDIAELEMLRKTSQKYSQIQQQNETLRTEKTQLEKSLFDAKIYQDDLENKDRFIRVLELQYSELQTELDRITERYNKNSAKVFAGLSKIDEEQQLHASYGNSNITLKELCSNFKNYLASKKELYYTDAHIRTFIAGFASSRLIILEGMSGTGKSRLPREFGEFIESPTTKIPVQSSWKDRNDLIGFYNDFEKRYKETDFLKAIYGAIKDKDNIHCILLDEMNLSRIEYYFADLLSVLEEPNSANWKISLVPDAASIRGEMPNYAQNGELILSENIWFAGTANKDDSTFTITDKVYDRAIVLNFKERAEQAKNVQPSNKINLSFTEFNNLIKKAVDSSDDEKKGIKSIVDDLDFQMQTNFEISFGNRIGNQITAFAPAFRNCGGNIEEAIDIIFSTKVLRKIQGYDNDTKNGLDELLKHFDKDSKYTDKFKLSRSIIEKMKKRM